MEPLLRRLTSHGLRRGLSGSTPWLVAGIVAIGMRGLRRLAAPDPDVFEITTRRGAR